MSFGRTQLRIGVSAARFYAESDFEARLPVAPQKPDQICERLNFRPEKVAKKKIYADDSSLLMENGFKVKYIEGDPK